jgi:DNA-binding CsgD family transcriptional regulator
MLMADALVLLHFSQAGTPGKPDRNRPCARRLRMATNVVELYQFNQDTTPRDLLEGVTIRAKADIADATAALEREVGRFGLRVMLWHDLATMAPMVDADGHLLNSSILGWGEEELTPFGDIDQAIRSPLLRACRVENQPFWINRHGIRTQWDNPYLNGIGLEDFDQRIPLKAAIVVPVHMPFGQIAAAIFTSANPARTDLSREFSRYSETLARLAERFMAGYVKVNRDPRYLPTENVLTARQIECLRWAALGKTDFEIGIIMGCSHAGVRYHMSRACLSLAAINRAQCVFRACQLGYIS